MNWSQAEGLVRHFLTAVGGVAVANGWITDSDLTLAAGATVTLLGVVWSYMVKRNA